MSLEYKLIGNSSDDDVIRHLRRSFFSDEPLNRAAGLCRGGSSNMELEHHSLETLDDRISLMAVNEAGDIAGVVLNGALWPGDTQRSRKQLLLTEDENFKKIFELLYSQNLKTNLFQQFDVERIFDIRILSVDARFRGRGIGQELVKRSEALARDNGYKLMKADATGIFSQKILTSNGFEILSEYYYCKYTDASGRIILPVEPPHIKLQLLYKQLLPTELNTIELEDVIE